MTLPWGKITDTDANSLSTLKNEDMVEHLRNMKELCRALHSDKDDRDMIVLRELLEGVLEHIISLPAQERDLDLKGKILNDFYLLMERCEKGSSWNILDTTLSAFSDFNETSQIS